MRLLIAALFVVCTAGSVGAETLVSASGRTALSLTVYGNGLALVDDRRSADLNAGANRLTLAGVSRRMIPASVVLTGDGLNVLELDYDFDVITPQELLRRSVGRTIGVVRTHPTTGEDTVEPATVLAAEQGVVLRYRDRIETGVPGRLVVNDLPSGLNPTPTLTATVGADSDGRRDMVLGYLTDGLSWSADYAAVVDDDAGTLRLDGRATVTNTTGVDFEDAALALVAGDVRRVSATPPLAPKGAAMVRTMAADAEAAPMPTREALADLHVYRLPRPVTLADRQSKQVALLSADDVPFVRTYVSESGAAVFHPARGTSQPTHPEVRLTFANDEMAGDQPLPDGVARLYTRDAGGSLRFLGEDTVSRTPVGEDVTLNPGRAFDVTVERTQTDFRRAGLPKSVFESAHRIDVRNGKDAALDVRLVELLPGDWEILEESDSHERETAGRAVWTLSVPSRGEATLTYRVRVRQ